jgi:LacI family transcriptional regulator
MNDRKGRKVTIKYIAELAGVSFSTVARALRGDPVVKEKTKKKILEIAEELHYYPNSLAKGLKIRKTETIGIILNDLKNPFFADIFKIIADTLNEKGYTMLLCDSNYDLELERKNIITMLSKGADGIVISPVNEKSDNIRFIIESDLKAVFIDSIPEFTNVNYVYVNHERAGFLATEYLIQNGHKNIFVINGPETFSPSKHFYEGYAKALLKHKISLNRNLIHNCDVSIENGYKAFKKMHKLKKNMNYYDFTGVITLSDLFALGVYEASQKLGFNIPDDYSIIGYDNIFAVKYVYPPLTTVHQPKNRIGQKSINILLEKILNDNNEFEKVILEPQLVTRKSVKHINL